MYPKAEATWNLHHTRSCSAFQRLKKLIYVAKGFAQVLSLNVLYIQCTVLPSALNGILVLHSSQLSEDFSPPSLLWALFAPPR